MRLSNKTLEEIHITYSIQHDFRCKNVIILVYMNLYPKTYDLKQQVKRFILLRMKIN